MIQEIEEMCIIFPLWNVTIASRLLPRKRLFASKKD